MKRTRHAVLVIVFSLLLVGCQARELEPANLVYGLSLVPSGIDPHIHASFELGIPLNSVYDTLVYLDPNTGAFVPGLATEWSVSQDGLDYTFYLRRDVRFHDGTRFNAEAVKFNLERVVNPDLESQKARYMLGQFAGVDVVDEYTAVVHLQAPYAPLLDSLSQVYLAMVSPTAVQKWGDAEYQFHQVGTGPYSFAEYIPGDHLTLVRNPEYRWGPEFLHNNGKAYVSEIEFRFFPDPATRAIALESGQIDVVGEVPPQDALRLKNNPEFEIVPVAIPGQPLQVFFNLDRPPTDELAVRQALIRAIDRETVVRTVFGEWSPVATAPLAAVTVGYVPGLSDTYQYNPDFAMHLLQDAGWIDTDGDGIRERNGQTLSIDLYYMSWGMLPEVAQMLEEAWRTIGCEVHGQLVSYPAALQAGANGDHNVIPFNLFGTDPAQLGNFYQTGGGFNWSKVSDAELDSWLEEAGTLRNREQRLALYRQAQIRIMENALILPLRDYVNLNVSTARVSDLWYDARGWFPMLVDIRLEN